MRAGITLVLLAGVLVAQTTIRGIVRDSAGLPVSGITVEAFPEGEPRTLVARRDMRIITGGAKDVEVAPKATLQVAVEPIAIY
jgi:hypothetical protein